MKVLWNSLAFLLFAHLAGTAQQSHFDKYTGPNALGGYRLDQDTDIRTIFAPLGWAPQKDRDLYCAADAQHGLYMYAQISGDGSNRVDTIFISSFPNCFRSTVMPANIDPSFWRTLEGIGIGSAEKDVLRAYGEPGYSERLTHGKDAWVIRGIEQRSWNRYDVGNLSYLYSCYANARRACKEDDLRATRIGFRSGKVIWILISNSE